MTGQTFSSDKQAGIVGIFECNDLSKRAIFSIQLCAKQITDFLNTRERPFHRNLFNPGINLILFIIYGFFKMPGELNFIQWPPLSPFHYASVNIYSILLDKIRVKKATKPRYFLFLYPLWWRSNASVNLNLLIRKLFPFTDQQTHTYNRRPR